MTNTPRRACTCALLDYDAQPCPTCLEGAGVLRRVGPGPAPNSVAITLSSRVTTDACTYEASTRIEKLPGSNYEARPLDVNVLGGDQGQVVRAFADELLNLLLAGARVEPADMEAVSHARSLQKLKAVRDARRAEEARDGGPRPLVLGALRLQRLALLEAE